jgi:hypothetical protein
MDMSTAVHTCSASGNRIYLSTVVLLTVGITDLVATLGWLQLGHQEGNPLFHALWSVGPSAFILGKTLFLLGPVALLEYARGRSPLSAEQGTWLAAAAYLALWGTQLVRLATGHAS